jgi:hypothetical protein
VDHGTVSARLAQNLAQPCCGGANGAGSEVDSDGPGESEGRAVALWGQKREDGMRRLTRRERKDLRRRAREDAELAARIQRAQRRLAQATGPLPVIDPRTAPDIYASEAPPARRSSIADH